jgi:hypothetical protein
MMLNNQTRKKKNYSLNRKEKGDKNGAEKEGGGEGVDECVIQRAHKISALRHVLNCILDNRYKRNITKVFKI